MDASPFADVRAAGNVEFDRRLIVLILKFEVPLSHPVVRAQLSTRQNLQVKLIVAWLTRLPCIQNQGSKLRAGFGQIRQRIAKHLQQIHLGVKLIFTASENFHSLLNVVAAVINYLVKLTLRQFSVDVKWHCRFADVVAHICFKHFQTTIDTQRGVVINHGKL